MVAAISLEGVSKSLSGRQVLRDLSFAVGPGDIFGCLFLASYHLPPVGVSIDYYPLIFVGLILLLSGAASLCSRALTKEKVVLSSKG